MRILSSLILFLIALNLHAKQYELSGETFSATLEIGTEDFIENPFFNLDISTDTNVKITLPKSFEEKFYIENYESVWKRQTRLHRWLLTIKEHEDFTLDAIILTKGNESLSFDKVEFKNLNKELEAPTLSDIFIDEEPKGKYYLILVMTLLTSIVYWITKRRNNIKVFKENINDLYEAQNTKDLCSKIFVHISKLLRSKYFYTVSGKSAEEISSFLEKVNLPNLANFIKDSNEIMFSATESEIDENLRKTLKEELEKAWQDNEV